MRRSIRLRQRLQVLQPHLPLPHVCAQRHHEATPSEMRQAFVLPHWPQSLAPHGLRYGILHNPDHEVIRPAKREASASLRGDGKVTLFDVYQVPAQIARREGEDHE